MWRRMILTILIALYSTCMSYAQQAQLYESGQTTCYDSAGNMIACTGTGQDGDIQAGVSWPSPRFTVSTDGYCVTDNLTGLMWVRSPDSVRRTWQQALDYANSLSLCGYANWRLPNRKELVSLVDLSRYNPVLPSGHPFLNVQSDYYWSSTTYAYYPVSAWVFHMWPAGMVAGNKSNNYYVWPVRSGQPGVAQLWETGQTTCYDSAGNMIACTGTGQDGDIQAGVSWPSPRFTVSTDGYCVTDNLTGLMWVRSPDSVRRTWQQALDYANSLSLCGYANWRLPNRKELVSLVDLSRYNPVLPSGHPFLNVQSDYYWSSTTYAYYPVSAWVFHMWPAGMVGGNKSNNYYVWPVRSRGVEVEGGSDVQVAPDTNITLNFSSVTTSGTVTVTTSGTGNPPPSGFNLGNEPLYYEITTTAVFTGLVKVCFNYNENNYGNENLLRLFHFAGGVWEDITISLDTVANIICGNTTSFSPFIVAESSSSSSSTPTIVSGVNLSGRMDGDQVVLTWSTGSERDNEGFIILRGESAAGPFSSITSAMIPATGGFGMRATYTFTDSGVEPGKTYYYRLQDIDSRGKVTVHQVIPVTVAEAKASGNSQENVNKEDNTTSASQQTAATTGVVALQINSGLPPTLVLPHKGGGDEEGDSVVALAHEEKTNAEVEIASGTVSPRNDSSDYHLNPPSPPFGKGGDLEMGGRGVVASGHSSFSVSIEDNSGNIIVVTRVEDTGSASKATGDLEVTKESGSVTLTWKGRSGVKGFILHRTEKGKEDYTAITSLIPYFGRDDKDIFLYKFTDTSIKPEVRYDYRLEVVKSDRIDTAILGEMEGRLLRRPSASSQ